MSGYHRRRLARSGDAIGSEWDEPDTDENMAQFDRDCIARINAEKRAEAQKEKDNG